MPRVTSWVWTPKGLLLLLLAVGLLVFGIILGIGYLRPSKQRAVLDQAIEAHGGEANLIKLKIGRLKGTGTKHPAIPFDWEETFDLPGRLKRTMAGPWSTNVYLYRDGKWWIRHGNQKPETNEGLASDTGSIVAVLADLEKLRDKSDQLTYVEETLDGRPVAGFQAVSPQGGKLVMFFDREIGLFVRLVKMPPADQPGPKMEIVCSEFHTFDGIRLPMRVVHYQDGQEMLSLTMTHAEFLKKIDDGVFAIPER